MTNVQKIIEFYGSQGSAADAIGVSQPTICNWLSRKKRISPLNAIKIEQLTNGTISRSDLRPDLFDPSFYGEQRNG